ncbi:hypothetical protein ACFL3T_02035 [Patescibacteria group bacterium]
MENAKHNLATETQDESSDLRKKLLITCIQQGIEEIAINYPQITYNMNTLEVLYKKILIVSGGEMDNPKGYAYRTWKYWAIDQIKKKEAQARREEREKEKLKADIDEIVAETKRKIAKQELTVVVNGLIESGDFRETQVKQLRCFLLSFTVGYSAAMTEFPEASKDLIAQWRKRAKDIILQQPITDNLNWYLDHHNIRTKDAYNN